ERGFVKIDRAAAGGGPLEDHADAEGRLVQFGARFELYARVGNEERDRCIAEDVDLQIFDLLGQYLLKMIRKRRHVATYGRPAVGRFSHLLRHVHQWLMVGVPDGGDLIRIEMEKALAVA